MYDRCTGGREEGGRRTDTDGEHHKGKPADAVGTRQTGRFQSQTKVCWLPSFIFLCTEELLICVKWLMNLNICLNLATVFPFMQLFNQLLVKNHHLRLIKQLVIMPECTLYIHT